MSLERFIKANLVVVPLLLVAGYVFYEWVPVIAVPLGVAYLTFVGLLLFAWGMSTLSLRFEDARE
ncbi:hypothetical protein [Natronolimnobius baerhuensis]|uniref:Cox cluster protein n=1 Tax=Natronolimnobius baerhuensis TaxID=253108 RepID=A0A202ECB0_9EURY|nr:hypothetical protein [Natronolimnobius baerhuensis]OVE85640.1 hypothetical protein B2G88_02100 [Natronolimnobius baerhuensis]